MNTDFFQTELAEVKLLISSTAKMTDPRAQEVLSGLIGAGGKCIRPKILMLSAMTGEYDAKKIRPLAAAVELLHTATLIHDDVIDNSPSRRGLPSAHIRIGKKDAVLAGDFLFSRCFLLASESTNPENAKGLARAIDVIVSAEIAQDSARWTFDPSIRACLRKAGGKTAVLFALSSRAGASEAKAPPPIISALSRSAWAAGVAFQIQDDILDWTGNELELGKTVMNDLGEGLCTLPLAYALGTQEKKLRKLLTPEAVSAGSAVEVASIVKSSGALEKSSAFVTLYQHRSLSDLEKLPPSFARDQLEKIFSSSVKRTK